MGHMEVTLNRNSLIGQRTRQISGPPEFLENLRAVETEIEREDDRIAALKSELKHARDKRQTLVGRLRAAARVGRVLPLFEQLDTPEPPADDGEAEGPDLEPE